jgi:hypothetical protein
MLVGRYLALPGGENQGGKARLAERGNFEILRIFS